MRTILPILDKFIMLQSAPDDAIINQLKERMLTDGSLATITSYSPNKVVVKATLENPGFLVLSDTYHPDWKAYDNGKETKIFITNYLIRSVFLSPGQHIVQFIFKPVAFYAGIIVSCIFLLILLSLLLLPKKNKGS